MHTWSKMRYKLENEYLADSLRGHIRYFATSYNKCPDHNGRAAILLDGREIIEGSYYESWFYPPMMSAEDFWASFGVMDDTHVKYGMFDQQCFYNAFNEFDNQSIEKSLESENMLIRIFAVLDRRVGKRKLEKIKLTIEDEPEMFRKFYNIRMQFEESGKRLVTEL